MQACRVITVVGLKTIINSMKNSKTCSASLKLLFAAIATIAIVLTYHVAREAIGLQRALSDSEETMVKIASIPVRFSSAPPALFKAKISASNRIVKIN